MEINIRVPCTTCRFWRYEQRWACTVTHNNSYMILITIEVTEQALRIKHEQQYNINGQSHVLHLILGQLDNQQDTFPVCVHYSPTHGSDERKKQLNVYRLSCLSLHVYTLVQCVTKNKSLINAHPNRAFMSVGRKTNGFTEAMF